MNTTPDEQPAPVGKSPTHRVFFVVPRPEQGRDRWLEIGAGWAFKDGGGLTIRLDRMPYGGFPPDDMEVSLVILQDESNPE